MSTSKAILITLLISLGIVIFTGYRITSRNLTVANQLVGEVQKLNVGQSSDSDLKQLDRKYHRYVDVDVYKRQHLVSPSMAAAAAVAGHFTDVRLWKAGE